MLSVTDTPVALSLLPTGNVGTDVGAGVGLGVGALVRWARVVGRFVSEGVGNMVMATGCRVGERECHRKRVTLMYLRSAPVMALFGLTMTLLAEYVGTGVF